MARWDWYQTTLFVENPQESGLVDHLLKAWPFSDWAPTKNLNGYLYGGQIVRGGRQLCRLFWGGQPGVNCLTTGEESPVLYEALKSFGVPHRPTRVDGCKDWQEEGFFDSVSASLIEFAKKKRLAIEQRGDWARGESRTLYIGSKESPARLVLYEKGYEVGGGAPLDWVRLEARIKPAKAHRDAVSQFEPMDVFGVSWIPKALDFFGWKGLVHRSVGTVWRRADEDRARAALIKQYGPIMKRWAEELGSWDNLGPAMQDAFETSSQSGKKTLASRAVTLPTS